MHTNFDVCVWQTGARLAIDPLTGEMSNSKYEEGVLALGREKDMDRMFHASTQNGNFPSTIGSNYTPGKTNNPMKQNIIHLKPYVPVFNDEGVEIVYPFDKARYKQSPSQSCQILPNTDVFVSIVLCSQ